MLQLSHFCQKIGPEISGVFWASDKFLEEKPSFFSEINYFLNGLLVKELKTEQKKKKQLFFLSEHFGNPFFIIYMKTPDCQFSELKQSFSLAEGFLKTKKDVLVVSGEKNSADLITGLKKNVKNFEFKPLN